MKKNQPKRDKKAEPPPPPRKSLLANLLLTLAAVFVTLLAAEIVCRLWFQKTVRDLRFSESDAYYYHDVGGVRRHIPNKIGYERLWNDLGRAEFRINEWGFRGPHLSHEKTAGVRRILFLGDSITLGGRLHESDIFVERVGRLLDKKSPGRWEILNAGMGDIGLREETEILQTGLKLSPDVVVLDWFLNDNRPPQGFPEEVIYKHPFIRWFNKQTWLQKSHLAGALYKSFRNTLVAQRMKVDDAENRRFGWIQPFMNGRWVNDPREFTALLDAARYDWGDAWDPSSRRAMQEMIRNLKRASEGAGARFLFVALPVSAQVYARLPADFVDAPQNDMAAFCKSEGIPFLDLLPMLRAKANEQLFYDHCHYTPRGNEVVAEAVHGFLEGNGIF